MRILLALSILLLSISVGYEHYMPMPVFEDCDYIFTMQQKAMHQGYAFVGTMINYEGRTTQLFIDLNTYKWLITEIDHQSLRACVINYGKEFINGY